MTSCKLNVRCLVLPGRPWNALCHVFLLFVFLLLLLFLLLLQLFFFLRFCLSLIGRRSSFDVMLSSHRGIVDVHLSGVFLIMSVHLSGVLGGRQALHLYTYAFGNYGGCWRR